MSNGETFSSIYNIFKLQKNHDSAVRHYDGLISMLGIVAYRAMLLTRNAEKFDPLATGRIAPVP